MKNKSQTNKKELTMLNKVKIAAIMVAGLFMFSGEINAETWVNGYWRSNGTWVVSHFCVLPDECLYKDYGYPGHFDAITNAHQSPYFNQNNNDYGSSSCYPIDE